ncbi:MAG: hypothetical protein VXZ38_03240 [Planctomycetota bacterium]|nr:hypothetical protein [Planctomycetota bacterium]
MLVVCVLLLILISAAYLFSERMLISNVASTGAVQARCAFSLSESGIAYTTAKIQSARLHENPGKAWPDRWRGEVEFSDNKSMGFFEISYWDEKNQLWSPGVYDESCKLNLNQIPLEPVYSPEARRMLMCIPGVTLVIADSILDWMDEDEIQREFGAESSYYQSKEPNRVARNERLDHLDDLLGVRGITPEILYGATGRSTWKTSPDPHDLSNAAVVSASSPKVSQTHLAMFFSVYGGPSLYNAEGNGRILMNQDDLVDLYDQLNDRFNPKVATYIVAYRLVGPKDKTLLAQDDFAVDKEEETRQRAERQNKKVDDTNGDLDSPRSIENRGPLKITGRGMFLIRSPYDLIGVAVEYPSEEGSLLIESPWPDNESTYSEALPDLNQELSFVRGTSIAAHVNVNRAPMEVLCAVPGMQIEVADRIILNRENLGIDARANRNNTAENRLTPVDWLRRSGTLDLEEMRIFAPYLTNLGTAFHFISSGYGYPNAHASRQEVVLDYRFSPSRVSYSSVQDNRDLFSASANE